MEDWRGSLERAHSDETEHLTATFNVEKAHALQVLQSELTLQYAQDKLALEEQFNASFSRIQEEHRVALVDQNSGLLS